MFHEKQEKIHAVLLDGGKRAISSVKLNKICSSVGLPFNVSILLNHVMVLENTEIGKSHSNNVCIIELRWSSVIKVYESFFVVANKSNNQETCCSKTFISLDD